MYKSTSCSCPIQKLLSTVNDSSAAKNFVRITNAEKKQTDSNKSSSSFIVYTISLQVQYIKYSRKYLVFTKINIRT